MTSGPIQTINTVETIAEMASLFARLVRGEAQPIRDPKTCEMITSLIPIIREHHGPGGGPFKDWLPRLLELRPSDLQVLASRMEALPVRWDGLAEYRPLYFVLDVSDGSWTPCYNAEDNRDRNGWIVGGVRQEDGTTATMPSPLGRWADCDVEDNPSMPFVEW